MVDESEASNPADSLVAPGLRLEHDAPDNIQVGKPNVHVAFIVCVKTRMPPQTAGVASVAVDQTSLEDLQSMLRSL